MGTRWAALLCAALILAGVPSVRAAGEEADEAPREEAAVSGHDDEIAQISGQLERLDAVRAQLEQGISGAQALRENAQGSREAVERQMDLVRRELDLLQQRRQLLESDLAHREQAVETLRRAIAEKQEVFDARYTLYLSRLRSMQLYDEGTRLSIVLGVDSYADYLTADERMRRLVRHDRELMEEVQEQRRQLEEDEHTLLENVAALQAVQTAVEADRQAVADRQALLAREQADIALQLHDIDEMERQFLKDLEQNRQKQAQMQEELERIYRMVEWDEDPYVGGAMLWPVPGYTQISSYFGPRFQGTDYHSGIDIFGTGILGKEVLAANEGTVRVANLTYREGKDYGIYVLLDHGGETSTLYAHLSGVAVAQGQRVERGQVIGYVGSTGWSTGPHLHFEVRVNKDPQNPLGFLQG